MAQLDHIDVSQLSLVELIEAFTALAVEIVQTPKTLTTERSKIASDAEMLRREIERRLGVLDTSARHARAYLTAAEGDMWRLLKAPAHLHALNVLADEVVGLFLVKTSQQQLAAGAHRASSNA